MGQGTLIVATLVLAALGVGGIALLAYLSARNQETEDPGVAPTGILKVDDAMELHRRRMFLRSHPEWEDRDFVGDRTSPWHTDPELTNRMRR